MKIKVLMLLSLSFALVIDSIGGPEISNDFGQPPKFEQKVVAIKQATAIAVVESAFVVYDQLAEVPIGSKVEKPRRESERSWERLPDASIPPKVVVDLNKPPNT